MAHYVTRCMSCVLQRMHDTAQLGNTWHMFHVVVLFKQVCDFGLASNSASQAGAGTPAYMAPELLDNKPYNEKVSFKLRCLAHVVSGVASECRVGHDH